MSRSVSINPATGEKIAEHERLTASAISQKIELSAQSFKDWRNRSFEERAERMHQLADVLEAHKEEYALLATNEMGKIIGQSRKEIEKCAWVCRYYADHAEQFLCDEPVTTNASKSYVTYQPMGVILAVMPWNFPFYQVIRFAAPAIMAGNVGILKHASNVQGCAQVLEDLFLEAGFQKGILTNLNISSDQVSAVIEHPLIAAVTLTGSEAAGRSVGALAGKNIKKSVLELGGSDAYLILEDADLEKAVDIATFGRLQNNGQTCIAAKRFIVLEAIYNDFLQLFKEKMQAAKMGDPKDEQTYYGPLARVDLRDELHDQVQKSMAQGAQLLIGGQIPEGKGAYYPATILTEVKPGMEAFDNELFGPVAAVIKAKDEAHAITLANQSNFGLGAGVLTGNKTRGEKIALQLDAGNCFVNTLVASDPRLPFGGIKNSGYGRELSAHGIREFMNVKTIWVA
ncbi:MAG: NAD-dependent succinate-semialdehyde dehydrogenase [Bacteroidetes bacterium]|nr:NAD-dependent succinate-semialdehyde dehydrogenase [Bacteroidota bacterium]